MCYIKLSFVSIQEPEHVTFLETDLKSVELTCSLVREVKDRVLLWNGNRRTTHIFCIKLTLEEQIVSHHSSYYRGKT